MCWRWRAQHRKGRSNVMLSGSKDAVIVQVGFVDIHGTYYCDIVYTHANEQPRQARIGKDDIYPNPQPGDAVKVVYIMNVVTGVQRAE